MMRKIAIALCSVLMFGCVSTEQSVIKSDVKGDVTNSANSIDKFTFDPLSKINKVEIPTYYDDLFKTARSYFEEKYTSDYIYISNPKAYVVEGEIISIAPWFPVSSNYTIFPTAHYLVVTQETENGLVSARYNHEQVIKLLGEEYKITESTSPFFHYVLELSPSQQANFEKEIHKKLSVLPSI